MLMSANVRLIKQKHTRGCTIACLAMLTGQEYDDVIAEFPNVDFDTSGIRFPEYDAYLETAGYALDRKYIAHETRDGRPWPPAPFADLHLCNVLCNRGAGMHHCVVMLEDGSVLDPLHDSPKRLSDYETVNNVASVIKGRFDNTEHSRV